jgi:hypothetical protein
MIPLDFVPGTHGHFLEYVLNKAFGFSAADFDPFTNLGTSHYRSREFSVNRQIVCNHWYEKDPGTLRSASKIIRIVFDLDDILLVHSISLLRNNDLNIDSNQLHIDTVKKLNNACYADTLQHIYQSYPDVDPTQNFIPRHVLREFHKFGFRDLEINGYWQELEQMLSIEHANEFRFKLKNIYQLDSFIDTLRHLASWLQLTLDIDPWLAQLHSQFMAKIPFMDHRAVCDTIIQAIVDQKHVEIPALSLLQESYINGRVENIFKKEMPFYQENYFTFTKDVLYYLETQAPNI